MSNCQNMFCGMWVKNPSAQNCKMGEDFCRSTCQGRETFNRFRTEVVAPMRNNKHVVKGFIKEAKWERTHGCKRS